MQGSTWYQVADIQVAKYMSNGPPILLPPRFAETWNASPNAVVCATTLGISLENAWCLQQRLKKQGVKLKAMPHNRPKFDHDEFVAAWNSAGTVQEVAYRLGISVDLARDRARRVRKAGSKLERMVKRVDVYGVMLTVRELCMLTGRSKSMVAACVAAGASPFGARR